MGMKQGNEARQWSKAMKQGKNKWRQERNLAKKKREEEKEHERKNKTASAQKLLRS